MLRFAPSGRSFAIGAVLVLLAGGLYALARETSMFAVRAVEVVGASPALAAEVRAELRSFDGRSLVSLSGAAVEQRVDGLPAVRSSVVDRAFPHTLRIRVLPELPVAVLRRGAESWLVSARGRVIACRPAAWSSRDLPGSAADADRALKGAFLTDEPGALAARSLAAFVGSGFSNRVAFVRALDGQITLGSGAGSRSNSASDRPAPEDRNRAGHPADLRCPARAARLPRRHRPERPVAVVTLNPQVEIDGCPVDTRYRRVPCSAEGARLPQRFSPA